MSGGGGGGGETVMMAVVAVLCWNLQRRLSGVSRREALEGLTVSVQGPALALRRQGAGTRHVVPGLWRWGSID